MAGADSDSSSGSSVGGVDVDKRDGVPFGGADLDEYLQGLSDDELADLKIDTTERQLEIKSAVDRAWDQHHSGGQRMDWQWETRARAAVRRLGYRQQCIQQEQGRRKRNRKGKAVSLHWAFVDAARQSLPPAQFDRLMKMAEQIVHNENLRRQAEVEGKGGPL